MAQQVDEVAQVGAGLFLSGIGPQEEREMLAGLWRAAVENQVGQEDAQPRRIDGADAGAIIAHRKLTQQLDVQARTHMALPQAGGPTPSL